MDAAQFVRELDKLRAFRASYVGPALLESLEQAGLLFPHVRVRYPDPIARRLWNEGREHVLKHAIEPDGTRWEAAVQLENRLYRWARLEAYGRSHHPLDDPEPRFSQFLEKPTGAAFVAWQDMRVDVSNDKYPVLFDDSNFTSYYSTWQLLQAAEVADAGVHFRINLADEETTLRAHEAIHNGRAPAANASFNLMPVHAMRDFAKHENTLNAVIWRAEETDRALSNILKAHGGGRFRLNREENARFDAASHEAAHEAARRHKVNVEDLVQLCRFLGERWNDWNKNGRPLIAGAYKSMLAATVQMAKQFGGLKFIDVRDRVGIVGGWSKPILDVIWPSWAEQQIEKVSFTLRGSLENNSSAKLNDTDVQAFAVFLEAEGLGSFFWRLKSFEDHAFRGNDFALDGMKSDLQGMAVAVEHIVAALGGTETQLYAKFKQVWKKPEVLALLKRSDVAPLARQERLAKNWGVLKAQIDALRSEPGGMIAADLVMAHRIRGGIHNLLPEDDQFELEGLLLTLMRAALFTFVEVRGIQLQLQNCDRRC